MIAIDLGSNSLRVLEYDCNTSKQIVAYEKVVKTADGLAQFGLINDDAITRVITAIKEMKSKVKKRSRRCTFSKSRRSLTTLTIVFFQKG